MASRYLVVSALSLLLGVPALSWGHARLVKSLPAQRAVVAQAPAQVQVWFNEPIEVRFSRLSVWNATGQQVDQQDLQRAPKDPKQLTVSLPSLAPGVYTVKFRVLSVDSHVIENQFSFTVQTSP